MNPCKGWKHRDRVSANQGAILGEAIQLGDTGRFKVRILTGPLTGRQEWPDGWVLGVGARLHRCRECYQNYRTDDPGEIFCPACNRVDHDGADSRRSARVALRGNATPTRTTTPAVPATVAADDEGMPF